jgi:predicted nucleic-acid-binding Zn-ribbon protein
MSDEVNSIDVQRAFQMARTMKWAFPFFPLFVVLVTGLTALVARNMSIAIIGLIVALIGSIGVYLLGIQLGRCPKCGQYWWSSISMGMGWLSMMMQVEIGPDETETYTCRKCGLEIGPHLRR